MRVCYWCFSSIHFMRFVAYCQLFINNRGVMKMRAVWLVVFLVLSILVADRALGQPGSSHVFEGRLVMQWGDPQPGDDGLHHSAGFNVELATEDGVRLKLDPATALAAAEDWSALFNAPLAVELDETEMLSSSIR